MTAKRTDKITWSLIEVAPDLVKENPKNPKIKNAAGTKRLKKLIERFGMVYDGIVNKDMTLIDGHSRKEISNGKRNLHVFVPSRQLSKKEYSEMNALFDLAKAGDPDILLMEETFGEEFFEEWGVNRQSVSSDGMGEEFVLPEGAKPPFQQMTFILADAQAERIKKALKKVKVKSGTQHGNKNKNGNALHQIVLEWAKRNQ